MQEYNIEVRIFVTCTGQGILNLWRYDFSDRENDYFKSSVFRQFSRRSVFFWHTDCSTYSFIQSIVRFSQYCLKMPKNGIPYISVICINPITYGGGILIPSHQSISCHSQTTQAMAPKVCSLSRLNLSASCEGR